MQLGNVLYFYYYFYLNNDNRYLIRTATINYGGIISFQNVCVRVVLNATRNTKILYIYTSHTHKCASLPKLSNVFFSCIYLALI